MRTIVEIVARPGARGRTSLPVVRAVGQLAARRTGRHTVHLVAAAAGPLGGDVTEVLLSVHSGARLVVRSVAAAVALPNPGGLPSESTVDAEVDDGAALELGLWPTVVAARADHRSALRASVAEGARLTCEERVVLGRTCEAPGRWSGTVRLERGGGAVLHSSVELGPGSPSWLPPFTPRAYVSVLQLGPLPAGWQPDGAATGRSSVRLPLPGGSVLTGWGEELGCVLDETGSLAESALPAAHHPIRNGIGRRSASP